MTKLLTLALAATAFAAAPAAAVTVQSAVSNGNSVNIAAAAPGTLSADFGILNGAPIVLTLGVEAGDAAGISFDSVVDSFLTVVDLGNPLGTLSFALGGGATFSSLGSFAPTFGAATGSLDMSGSVFTLRFIPAETSGVTLGDVGFGGTDFGLSVGSLGAGDTFTLTVTGTAVPEPASWALLIAGFGIVGAVARRRRTVVAA